MKVGSRSRYRRGALVYSNRPNSTEHLAVSIRKKRLGGFELVVHVLDVSAYSPVDSPLDSEASDRMGSLDLPDHARPLYPIPPDLLAFRPGEKRPSLTLTWKLDKNMVPGSFRIRSTTFRVECFIEPTEIEDILNGHIHTHSVAVLRLNQLVNLLVERRRNNGAEVLKFPRSMWNKTPLNTCSGWWQSQIPSWVSTRWNGKRQHSHWYQNPQP